MVVFPKRGFGNRQVQRRITTGCGCLDPFVVRQRAIKLLLLGVQLRQGTNQLQIIRFGLQPRFVLADQFFGEVFRFHLAVLLFQRNSPIFVFQNIPIRAGAVRQGFVASIFHGLARGHVLQSVRQIVVVGERAAKVREDFLRPHHVAGVGQRVGKFNGHFGVLGRILHQDLQGQNGGARHLHCCGCFNYDLVRTRVGGVAVEDLLGNLQRFGRIPAQRELALGHQRRRTGAAEDFLEEAAASAPLSELRSAQRFAAFIHSRFFGQNLVEQIDCVIKVFPQQGIVAFGEKRAQIARQVIQALFCHFGTLIRPLPKNPPQICGPQPFLL